MAIQTGSATANGSFSSLSISGTTSKSGNITWTAPSIPNGATITSTTLTATLTISMNRSACTVTINGSDYYSTTSLDISLGTSIKSSLSVSAKGGNKNATGTVSMSNIIYTINYTYDDGQSIKLIYLGDTQVTAMYLGGDEINSIYIGDTLIYQK